MNGRHRLPEKYAKLGLGIFVVMSFVYAAVVTFVGAEHSALYIGIAIALFGWIVAAMVLHAVADSNHGMRLQSEKLRAVARHFDMLMFDYDPDRDTLVFNIPDTSTFSLNAQTMDHCTTAKFEFVHPDDLDAVHDMFKEAQSGAAICEFRLLSRNGSWLWCGCRIEQIEVDSSHIRVGMITSIDEHKNREIKLIQENMIDPQTGLLRREAFEEQVNESLATGRRGMYYFFDLNMLKTVNDMYGHDAGDELLKMSADIIRSTFRASDPVSRRSGDEFYAYTSGIVNDDQAREKAQRIIDQIGAIDKFEGIRPSISIGIARFPQNGRTVDELGRAADEAMYHAKRIGKCKAPFVGCSRFYGEE